MRRPVVLDDRLQELADELRPIAESTIAGQGVEVLGLGFAEPCGTFDELLGHGFTLSEPRRFTGAPK
jgi:hypothetical protein